MPVLICLLHQRSCLDVAGHCQRPHKVRQVVGQRAQPEPGGVRGEGGAGVPRSLQHIVAIDVLFGCAPGIVERQNPLVRQAAVRRDEADAGRQFARLELYLPTTRRALGQLFDLKMKARVAAHDVVRRWTRDGASSASRVRVLTGTAG